MRRLKASLHALVDLCVRGLAVVGVFSLVLGLMSARWDGSWLWSRGGGLPAWFVEGLVVLFALVLLFGRRIHPAGGFLGYCLGVLLAVACLADAMVYFGAQGAVPLENGVPPGLVIGALLLLWVATVGEEPYASESRTRRALWLRVVDRASR